MHLSAIRLENFRRLKEAQIDLEDDLTIFVGPNNSGKTSATHALNLFLAGSQARFSLYDFNADCWGKFSEIEAAALGDVEAFPRITMDLWLSVEESDLHRVVDLLPSLDWNGSRIGLRVEYGPRDIRDLLANYYAVKQASERHAQRDDQGALTYHPWPRSLRDYLERELRKEYKLRYFVLDHTQFESNLHQRDGYEPSEIVPDQERSGEKILKSLLRVDFLSAQRHLDDGTHTPRAQDLSRRLSRFYARNLRKREDDHQALRALAASEDELTRHFTDVFQDTFKQLRKLGYPGLMNPQLQIRAALQMERLMGDQQAKIHYLLAGTDSSGEPFTLPDHYNGLGFKNLIYMGVELLDVHASWLEMDEDNADIRPPLHLIFVEEPEAHMHAQLQQAFVRKLADLLGPLSDGVFRTQFVITTHSAHVVFERGFRHIRYFRRNSESGSSQISTVHNLSQYYRRTPEDRDFLERYMKLTHCDLFFADAAVLVEGNVERLLLPHIIERDVPQLLPCYLSILEVGGAFAHRFRSLLEFIGLTALVITDLDSVHPKPAVPEEKSAPVGATEQVAEPAGASEEHQEEESEESALTALEGKSLANEPGAVTSNQTLIQWLPGKCLVSELLAEPLSGCIQESSDDTGARVCVVYQRNSSVMWKGNAVELAGRTFEEALAFANLEWMHAKEQKGLQLRVRSAEKLPLEQLVKQIHKKVKSESFKKTDLALSLLAEFSDTWKTPDYIRKGLDWLAGQAIPIQEIEPNVKQPEKEADE